MRGISTFTVMTVTLVAAPWTFGDSELITSFSYTSGRGGGWGPPDPPFTAVKFWLENDVALGDDASPYWHEGESGTYDFTINDASGFDDFIATISNGVVDSLLIKLEFEPVGGGFGRGTHGEPEDVLFGTPGTDLIGYEIDRVRLIVHDVHFWIDPEEDLLRMEAPLTWEFWGTPEPGTFCMLVIGGLIIRRRCG